MRTVFAATAAAVVLGGAAPPAAAAVHQVTYTGKVGYGFDLSGMFGAVGSLNEERYSLVYTIDDLAAGAVHVDGPDLAQISGSGANSPVRAAITVKGVTWQINGGTEGYAQQSNLNHANVGGYDYVEQKSTEYAITPTFYHSYFARTWIAANGQDFLPSAAFGTPYSYDPLAQSGGGGYYNLVELNDSVLGPNNTYSVVNYAFLNLTIDGVSVSTRGVDGAVPEPASWAMLILGFGGAGAMLRRRGRELAAA